MILVSIYIKEDKLFIQVKHKIIYQVEKQFQETRNKNFINLRLFTYLFVSIIKLGFRELQQRLKTPKQPTTISDMPINYIEGK